MCTCCTVVFWWQFPVEWYHSCTRLLSGIPCGPFRHHWYVQERTTTYLQRGQKKKILQANQKSYEKTLELSCQFPEEKFPVKEANQFLSWNKIERYRPKFDHLHPENHTTHDQNHAFHNEVASHYCTFGLNLINCKYFCREWAAAPINFFPYYYPT